MDLGLFGLQGLQQVFNVHPVFVHFPIALFPSALLLYGLGIVLNWRAAFHTAMAERVLGNPSWSSPREREEWLVHCAYLSQKYLEAAEASEALAEEHEGHADVLEGVRELQR